MDLEISVYADVTATEGELLKALKMPGDTEAEDLDRIRAMFAEAGPLARPKSVLRACAIEAKGEGFVVIEGVEFPSPLLRKNLDRVHRAVAYVATCGTELEDWSRQYSDPLEGYWADGVKLLYLQKARARLFQAMKARFFQVGDMSSMNPGSLPSWPISEQRRLFALIGDVAQSVGVRLTDTFLMLPSKSISGLAFQSETHFENCQYCPMPNCPGRRAQQIV